MVMEVRGDGGSDGDGSEGVIEGVMVMEMEMEGVMEVRE